MWCPRPLRSAAVDSRSLDVGNANTDVVVAIENATLQSPVLHRLACLVISDLAHFGLTV
jgi:hypothetical protein